MAESVMSHRMVYVYEKRSSVRMLCKRHDLKKNVLVSENGILFIHRVSQEANSCLTNKSTTTTAKKQTKRKKIT